MKSLERGDIIRIKSVKFPDQMHRIWKKSVVLQAENPLILANYDVEVVNADGSEGIFQGLAICIFFQDEWFNTILLYNDQGRLKEYYINIASPYQLDQEHQTLTYIDYDIDFIVTPTLEYVIVDEDEFADHQECFHYPDCIVKKISQAVVGVEERIRTQQDPFHPVFAQYWYQSYQSLKRGDGRM
ncbi:DUF402 domain-containing protein [Thermoflavimicrobium daqui]|jgi:protein associated with RNAse G/E|uniref:DUF402 domain-containing protein n=1 Tax=Thermoflavimicrobium daqui TaxID=2137476 RepID=A0A364K4R0_9BACL|nr:DUF402 domain-containing protein [Thermoflavimicrobium daqui]RAL24336.1 hypothetical protein DL897_08390 [Thermoflavimicrobium daqui]